MSLRLMRAGVVRGGATLVAAAVLVSCSGTAEVSREPPLSGLYERDSQAGSGDALAFGILKIELPCVYINEIDSAGQTIRMPHGDKVRLHGGPDAIPGPDAEEQAYEGGCSAHEVFWTLEVHSNSQ